MSVKMKNVDQKRKDAEKIKVEDIMVKDVAYVEIPADREKVLDVIRERQVSGIPVVKDGRVLGMVTRGDLLRKPEEEQVAMLMRRNPVTISHRSNIYEASKLLIEKGIRRLPVVEDDKLLGIITVADIVRVISKLDYDDPIGKYTKDNVIALWENIPLPVAGRMMELAGIKAAPVLNNNFELTGIITDRDLINAAMIEDKTEISDMSSADDQDEWAWEGMRGALRIYYSVRKIKLPDRLVKDVMVKDIITATKTSTVSDCARKMIRNKFDQLPVISANRKLIGMLFDRDLLNVFFR